MGAEISSDSSLADTGPEKIIACFVFSFHFLRWCNKSMMMMMMMVNTTTVRKGKGENQGGRWEGEVPTHASVDPTLVM